MIDGDIYGPNVPIMLGLKTQLTTDGQKILPAEKYGLQVISMGFMTTDDAPIIWRGPMLHGALQQFFREVRWDDLDYLVIDMPPGTGDVALSLSQTVPVAGAIVVTTPQQVSLADSRRAVAMYKKLNIPTLGIVENMSYFVCRNCNHEADIFGHGGGEQMAAELKRAVPRARADLPADSRGRRQRRAAAHQRARVAGGPRVHRARRSGRRRRCRSPATTGPPYRSPSSGERTAGRSHEHPVHQAHARERPRRAAARGPQLSDRRGQHLVSRRIEERDARATPASRICSST